MKRVWGHVLAGASLVCGAATLFSACTHNNSSLYIKNVLANKYSSGSGGMGCGYTNDPTQAYVSSGILDYHLSHAYDALFMVGNQLVPQGNANQLRTETAVVTVQGVVVRITDVAGRQLATFTNLTSGTVNPASGATPGWQAVAATIINPPTVESNPDIQLLVSVGLARGGSVRLITYTRFFGSTLGGQSVESNEFEYPVDVCNGCLVAYTNASLAPDGGPATLPNCFPTGSTQSTSSTPAVPCVRGQDIVIDCTAL